MKLKKKKKADFIAHLAASLVQPVISSVVKFAAGRAVRRAGKGYMDKQF